MRIDMFVYNRCTTDARVLKEATTLTAAGHDVRIVAVLDATTERYEERDGFRIVRIERNPIDYRVLRAVRARGGVREPTLSPAQRVPARLTGTPALESPSDSSVEPARRRKVPVPLPLLGGPVALARRLGGVLGRGVGAGARGLGRRLLLAPHKPLLFFDYYMRAYRLVRAAPPDALHAHDLNTLPVGALLARRLALPLVYDAHELYPEISTLSRKEAAVWRLVEGRLARRADHVLTVCESIAGELTRRYEIATPTVVLNCPPAPGPVAAEDRRLLRERVGLSAVDDPIVLYQGGFSPHRGLSTLVLAAHELERGTIVLMGWGRLEEELRELVEREGLQRRVILTGPVPQADVMAYASGASVGVIPYEPVGLNNTYTTPNKLFDYMAVGLPVVASRLPELVRFVEEQGLGMVCAPGDPRAMALTINRVLGDPLLHARMRARALDAATAYTWERESRKVLDLYSPPEAA